MQKEYALPRPYEALGKYLSEARQQADLTQRQVSLALRYSSAQFISNFERGIAIPPLKKLKTLIDLYDLDRDEVVEILIAAEKTILRAALRDKKKPRAH